MLDFSKMITAEEKANKQYEDAVQQAIQQRKAAYLAESDHLKTEAEYDASVAGVAVDYSAWHAAVQAIKDRFPMPVREAPQKKRKKKAA